MTDLRSLPDWSLRLLLRFSVTRRYWMAALIELHRRAVEEVVAETVIEDSGAYPVIAPPGVH